MWRSVDIRKLKKKYASVTGSLRPVSQSRVALNRRQHPGIPKDYFQFMRVLGAGPVEPMIFKLYEDLLPPSDFIDDSAYLEKVKDMVVFGDAYGTYWAAMHQETGMVFVLDPPFVDPQGSFADYIVELLDDGMDTLAGDD